MKACETAESSQTPVVKATDKGKNVVQENQPQQKSVSVASLSVQQLHDVIANSIRAQYGGPPQTSFMYSKPYTKRIDNLRMPFGYQPPKFQQFDGKGNPKQHIAHKKKGRRNKKMWKPKPIKGKDEDFLQPRRSITLAKFLPRSFLEDHLEEILEVTACHTTSIVEVDNNYDFYEEMDNSNEIKQKTPVFDRIKPLTTRSSVFQRLSSLSKIEYGHEKRRKPMSNVYLRSNFSFQKAKHLYIEETSTFNICF
ncbi:ty3-gypsy retrotransposon protein [Cucumis melo var. makuwa]|uniref:Ty3-gypsy retrotransposon protein n=1 Tax=Cucumis melo var. makuwa TaxID=1194695 RepID=A0A5D3C6L7_CUCMM|nr:ty3-gypsy retrotransposon protein [Cucumis melo var. makuwa]